MIVPSAGWRHAANCEALIQGAYGKSLMVLKVMAVGALVSLPLTVTSWYRSHREPTRHRWDLTEYKSIDVILRNGVCGLHVLSMPTLSKVKSEFTSRLQFNTLPNNSSLLLSSQVAGPYRHTWLVFPFWLPTILLLFCAVMPICTGPMRRLYRRRRGLCVFCGYDLRGSRGGICSECGGHA